MSNYSRLPLQIDSWRMDSITRLFYKLHSKILNAVVNSPVKEQDPNFGVGMRRFLFDQITKVYPNKSKN